MKQNDGIIYVDIFSFSHSFLKQFFEFKRNIHNTFSNYSLTKFENFMNKKKKN